MKLATGYCSVSRERCIRVSFFQNQAELVRGENSMAMNSEQTRKQSWEDS